MKKSTSRGRKQVKKWSEYPNGKKMKNIGLTKQVFDGLEEHRVLYGRSMQEHIEWVLTQFALGHAKVQDPLSGQWVSYGKKDESAASTPPETQAAA